MSRIYDAVITSGFEATVQACKTLGLDISTVPMSVLQIFYNSGMAFADSPGAFTTEQKKEWRDSVIWPRKREDPPMPESMPKLPPIIKNPRKSRYVPTGRPPGRPRKTDVPVPAPE